MAPVAESDLLKVPSNHATSVVTNGLPGKACLAIIIEP